MWINVVEANAKAFGWSDRIVKYQALQKLRNTAQTWYNSLQKNETRWTTWKWKQWRDTLLDTFQTHRNMYSMLKELMQVKPIENQSLYEFYFQQKSRIDRLRLLFSEQDIISIIVGSIGNANICTAAEAGNFRYCDELASFLHGKTYSIYENKSVAQRSNSIPRYSYSRPLSNKREITENNEPTVNSNFTQNVVCFRCGETGHKKTHCPASEKIKCNHCSKLGHVESVCRKAKLKTENNVEVKRIATVCSKDKFMKEVLLNNCKCQAFIDMGSSCSLITPILAKELNLLPFRLKKIIVLTGFKTDAVTQVTHGVNVHLLIDKAELNITMYLLDNLSGCPLLIGRNFTEDKSIMYMRVGNNLTFCQASCEQVALIDSSMFDCSSTEQNELLNNLFSKYPQVIAKDLHSLGLTSCIELEIELTTNKPVYQRPYRMSEAEKVLTRELVDDLKKNNIIRESSSPYASPAILVNKPNGEKRLCIDYRALNKITVKEKYPMPITEDLISRLHDAKIFTSLDLKSGYYHVKCSEGSIPKTAFVTPDGHYEFLRMPFGLCNAPSVFQRLMDMVLGKLRFERIICFMDDLLIATPTLDENIQQLENVLEILQKNGLTINLDKCHFFKTCIDFLGYRISVDGLRPSSKKLKAVEGYPVPQNAHQVRQFLGLINYFRKFIKNCAILSRPLTSLLKRDSKWEWGIGQLQAFSTLKKELLENAVLNIFNPKLPIILYSDASREGVACILTQITDEGERPVHFYSRQTTNEEKKYHSFELEFLAIVVGLQKFRHYLLGSIFKIITDCNAVKYTINKKDINSRIGRWVLLTQEFTFEILHRPGTQMQHVDALSRNPPLVDDPFHVSIDSVMAITEGDWLLSVQLQDPNICSIREILESGNAESHKKIFKDYELLGNKVYRRTEYGRRWLVPKKCIWQIIRANHDDLGHFAIDKTVDRIRSLYWFPKIKKIVTKYVKNCLNCIFSKSINGKKEGKLFPIPKYARPFHTLHIDHLGPFVKTTLGNTYILVTVDSFTKFVFISSVRNTKSRVVVNELNKIFKVFGNPKRLICDAGSAFTSHMFVNFCKKKTLDTMS